jgi:hypothetical protein
VRENQADQMRYLRVPADPEGTMNTFMQLRQAMQSKALAEKAARAYVQRAVDASKPELAEPLTQSALKALELFAGQDSKLKGPDGRQLGGLQAISDFMDSNVPEAERERAGEVLVRILNGVLFELAQQVRQQAGLKPFENDEKTQAFMTQSVFSLSDAQFYPAPVVFMLQDFKQVQASVFQVARAPGKNIVYLGCLFLIIGVFAMLYVRDRRIWIWLTPANGQPCEHGLVHQPQDHGWRPRVRHAGRQADRAKPLQRRLPEVLYEHRNHDIDSERGYFARRNWFDWLFAVVVAVGLGYALQRYAAYMDVYEKGILLATIPAMIWMGWFWRPLAVLMLTVAGFSLMAIGLYQGGWRRAGAIGDVFGLKYFLSSQSAILWMSMVFFISTASTGSACLPRASARSCRCWARAWRGWPLPWR